MADVFNYEEAFCRNLGWVTPDEVEVLKKSKVAIGGVGGVGGVHLITLIRLGVQNFHISDPDEFEVKNFNRQYGADMSTLGQNKCDVMLKKAQLINPSARIKVFAEGINKKNLSDFLEGVDLYVDGLDLFEIETREYLFEECHRRGIPCVVVAPVGMGASVITFTKHSMTFEKYFGLKNKDIDEKIIRFSLGIAPSLVHLQSLVERKYSNLKLRKVSSTPMGCQMAAGVMGTEVLKLILKRGKVYLAPQVIHYDAYTYKLKKSRTYFGSANPLFKIKLFIMKFILNSLNSKNKPSSNA